MLRRKYTLPAIGVNLGGCADPGAGFNGQSAGGLQGGLSVNGNVTASHQVTDVDYEEVDGNIK